jgi:FlaA1/EpsC-like NDP-sugar epimerase
MTVLLSGPRFMKRAIAVTFDISICLVSVWLAYFLRLDQLVPLLDNAWLPTLVSVLLAIPIFMINGLYRTIFRFSSGWPVLLLTSRALAIYGLIYFSIFTVVGVEAIPRAIGILQPIILGFLIISSRLFAKYLFGEEYVRIVNDPSITKVLIYGAGNLGCIALEILRRERNIRVMGFLDDDVNLHRHYLSGKSIYNPIDLSYLVRRLGIRIVLLAMADLSHERRMELVTRIRALGVDVQILPNVIDSASGRLKMSDIREVQIEDLLGREPIAPDPGLMKKNIANKVVLVTGAGGSIGSEISKKIALLSPKKLLLIDRSEYALYSIYEDLNRSFDQSNIKFVPILADVCNQVHVLELIKKWRPEIIFHAAAHKHVGLVESNPWEGIRNNAIGTLCVARAASKHSVDNFVLISTDKAVDPLSVMGVSKRLAEMVVRSLAGIQSSTTFSLVRFGNVLGSSGSVVQKFRRQIRDGGPITVTHPKVSRYFMTISEAAELVIQASSLATGGDIFVLDMGEPIEIVDLARRMITLSGLTVRDETNLSGEIAISYTGLIPGEKLSEVLFSHGDVTETLHPRISKVEEEIVIWEDIKVRIESLERSLRSGDYLGAAEDLKHLLPRARLDAFFQDYVNRESSDT